MYTCSWYYNKILIKNTFYVLKNLFLIYKLEGQVTVMPESS